MALGSNEKKRGSPVGAGGRHRLGVGLVIALTLLNLRGACLVGRRKIDDGTMGFSRKKKKYYQGSEVDNEKKNGDLEITIT